MQEVKIEPHCFQDLEKSLISYKSRNIFLVTGSQSYSITGAQKIIEELGDRFKFTRFSNFSANPKIDDALMGTEIFRQESFDLILAIGGGSVIDMAKLIKVFATEYYNPDEIINGSKSFEVQDVPFIACPTTSGAGSEATHFAVLYKNKKKYSIAHEKLLPDLVLIDPILAGKASANVKISSGLDALCQGIESYWSKSSTDESKIYASEAIKLVFENIDKNAFIPTSASQIAMSKGAYLAGKAINITKTTAPHALSYYLTSHHSVSHGHAVAIFLPLFFEFNWNVNSKDCNDAFGPDNVRNNLEQIANILNCSGPEEFRLTFSNLMDKLSTISNIQDFSFYSLDLVKNIIKNVNLQRVANNPRKVNKNDLFDLLTNRKFNG